MRIITPLIVASALAAAASGSAIAQGRSAEADIAQGVRQSQLAFTEQSRDRGFLGIRGVFLPVLTGGFLGDTRAYDDRAVTNSITQRPMPYQRPGAVNNREWFDDRAYGSSAYDDRPMMRRGMGGMERRYHRSARMNPGVETGQVQSANRGVSSDNPSQRGMR